MNTIEHLEKKLQETEYLEKLRLVASKKPKENIILFFGRHNFSDNSKYLFLAAQENKAFITPVWCTYNTELSSQLNQAGLRSIDLGANPSRTVALMLKAAVVVHCVNPYEAVRSDVYRAALSSAYVLQLWHGVGSKKLDLALTDKANLLDIQFIQQLAGAVNIDCILSPAQIWDSCWHQFFGVKKYIRAGLPRNEVLKREATAFEKINAYQFKANDQAKRKILWAPTFSGSDSNSRQINQSILNFLSAFTASQNVELYIKPHPYEAHLHKLAKALQGVQVIDAVLDIYPVLKEFDALITDFSSIASDFMLVNKPIVFCASQQVLDINSSSDQLLPLPGVSCTPEKLQEVLTQVLQDDAMAAYRQAHLQVAFETDPLDSCREINKLIMGVVGELS